MPEVWTTTNLKSVTKKIGSGSTPRGGKSVYVADGAAFIRSQNVYDHRFEASGIARISADAAHQLRSVAVAPKDVLICITGESVTRTSIVSESVLPAHVSQHVSIVRADPDLLDAYFLQYSLLSPDTKNFLNTISEAGATRRALTKRDLENLEISFPSLPEQRSIAGVLRTFDDLIDTNRQLMEDLDGMYQAEWLRLFGASLSSDQMFPLADLVSTQYGYTASATDSGADPKFLRVMDINKRNWIDWTMVPHCPIPPNELEKYRLRKGDIVVARMADPGKSAIVDDDSENAVFASYLVRLKPKNPIYSQYIYGLLKSQYYLSYSEGAAGGSVQKNMNAKVITGVCIGEPPVEAVKTFDSFGRNIRECLNELVKEVNELTQTRDVLLPMLLSGKITPNRAAKLLEDVTK